MEQLLTQLIYISMVLLIVFAFINFRGKGILSLFWASVQLRRAAKKLTDEVFANQLRTDILSDTPDTSEELFWSKSLRHQMSLFRAAYKKMGISELDKYQCDIEDYFNTELLDYEANNTFTDHAANGLTALGILGTFLGMAAGLTGFDISDADTIISGISRLLLGMSTAFETSIAGLTLSLLLGTLANSIRGSAEKALSRFLDNFRSNVLSNQSEAAANLLLERLENLEKLFSADSDARQETMSTIANEFVAHMGENLTEHVAEMRTAMEEATKQQYTYIKSIQGLCTQVEAVGQKIVSVSTCFDPVIEQSRLLSNQIMSANQALQAELKTVSGIVSGDAAILSQQHDVASQMNAYATNLEALALRIAEQTAIATSAIANLSACSTSAISDSQTALEAQLRTMMLSASDFNDAMALQSKGNIAMLQDHMEQVIQNLPRTSGGDALLKQLTEQNEIMIENQEKLLIALGHAGMTAKKKKKRFSSFGRRHSS